jgi:hypothetical protein
MKYINQNIYLSFMLLGTFLLSCSNHDNSNSIDLSKNQEVSVFDVFSDIEVIQLETTEAGLISQIVRIQYYNSRYYILDQQSQQIFCFDEQGRLIFKISAQGKGLGEYHYITDFNIDARKEQLVVLDPVVQKIHYFDLNGKYLSTYFIKTDYVIGLNRVYPLEDSLVLLISVTYENVLFYSLEKDQIIHADFSYDVPGTLHTFSPRDNVRFFENKSLFLKPLTNEVAEITAGEIKPFFTWDFGKENNTSEQISRLIEEIKIRQEKRDNFKVPYQAVGKNKPLSHHIITFTETPRFRIAVVEFENDFKYVVIDKEENKVKVFNLFREGIRIPFQQFQTDRAIAFYKHPYTERTLAIFESEGTKDYYMEREKRLYALDILSKKDREIIENHDPMKDNPFLVVYKFKQ